MNVSKNVPDYFNDCEMSKTGNIFIIYSIFSKNLLNLSDKIFYDL